MNFEKSWPRRKILPKGIAIAPIAFNQLIL